MKKLIMLFICLVISQSYPFNIDRIILATNENPDYIEFWPIVAQVWAAMGFKPTLALIAPPEITVDETLGDVIRFDPIPGVPTSVYAQAIRILLPTLFENDICLISDIDMIPINKEYFVQSVQEFSDTDFVSFSTSFPRRITMCYNAAKGSTFKEIFNISHPDQIPQLIAEWYSFGHGFYTDERMLYKYIMAWKNKKKRYISLQHQKTNQRIDRNLGWKYTLKAVKNHFYIDIHCKRPYSQHKSEIDKLVRTAGFDIKQ